MLGIWPGERGLDLKKDFRGVLYGVGNWELHALISEGLTFEKVVLDAKGQFEVIYLAAHQYNDNIVFGDENLSIATFSSFAEARQAKLVVLGVCEGYFLANMLLDKGIETIVYWLHTVEDEHAITFARIFFASLSEGNTVQGAIENAKYLLPLEVSEGNLRLAGHRNLKFPVDK